jgi:hypothetical protein
MFDAFFASNTPPSLLPRSTVAASLLHLILVVVTIELNTARPHTVHPRAWVPPAPVVPPQVPDLPYMPTVDAAALMRHPLHITALAGMAPTDVPLERRPGITSEVQLEYVIFHTGRRRLGSVSGDRRHRRRVSSVQYWCRARRQAQTGTAGRPVVEAVRQFDFRTANPVVIELSSSGKQDVAGPPYFRGTITLPLEVVACSRT